jgi:hypothetical protein
MPLLRRNIDQNRSKFLAAAAGGGTEFSVHAKVLRWGNQEDANAVLEWMNHEPIIASD